MSTPSTCTSVSMAGKQAPHLVEFRCILLAPNPTSFFARLCSFHGCSIYQYNFGVLLMVLGLNSLVGFSRVLVLVSKLCDCSRFLFSGFRALCSCVLYLLIYLFILIISLDWHSSSCVTGCSCVVSCVWAKWVSRLRPFTNQLSS